MNICGTRRRSEIATRFSMALAAIVVALALAGCGTANNTYSPIAKTTGPTPGFTIAVTPGTVSVVAGNTANYTVTITETGGFNSPITLSASNLPANSVATFGTPAATATGSTVPLSIATDVVLEDDAVVKSKLSTPKSPASPGRLTGTGNTTFTVTGVGGGLTASGTAIISITGAPDFSITLTPASTGSNIVAPGGTAQFIATLTSFAGFSSPVTLSLSGNPATTNVTFGSNTVTPTVAGATTTVSIATSDNEGAVTTQASYPLTLTGTAGTLSNTASATLGVGSFTLTVTNASTGSGTVLQGNTAQYIVTLKSNFGFAPVVTLTPPALPSGCTPTFGSNTLTPTASGATTTLSIATTGSTAPVTDFNFDVGAQGGGWDSDGTGVLTINGD